MKNIPKLRAIGLVVLAWSLLTSLGFGQRMPQDSWYLKKTVETGMFAGGIARDSDGNVYLSDAKLGLIKKFSPTYQLLQTWGGLGTGDGQFGTLVFQPWARFQTWTHIGAGGLCFTAAQELVVCDPANHRVQIFSRTGSFLRKFGTQGSGDGQFNSPVAAAASADNRIYVADRDNHRIQVFSSAGSFLSKLGSQGGFDGQLKSPTGIGFLSDGKVAVADSGNRRIQVFTAGGIYVRKLANQSILSLAVSRDDLFFSSFAWLTSAIAGDYSWYKNFRGEATLAWGDNASGQTTIPSGLSGVVAIAAGYEHTVALKNDGTVTAWGSNGSGQITIPSGLSGVVAIAAGNNHTIALKNDGTVTAWGSNSSGQTTIPSGLSGVVAIAAGNNHTIALKNDGTVTAWGFNGSGQTTIPSGLSGVAAIAAGSSHTVALKNDGTVTAWGYNGSGQITIPSGLSGVVAIAAGYEHTVALKNDGTVTAWGYNGSGQITIPSGLSGVVAIAADGNHTVALKYDGTVTAWGKHYIAGTSVPITIPSGLSGVVVIAAGGNHTVALKNDGGSSPASLCALPNGDLLMASETGKLLHYARTFRTILPESPNAIPRPVVLSTAQRAGSGLVDVDYRVDDVDNATLTTAAVAFRNGGTGLNDVIPIHTLAEGTAAKLGAGVATGQSHRFTWDARADVTGDFEQLQVEVLAKDGRDLFNLDFIQIPAEGTQPALKISKTPLKNEDFLSAWLWLIGTKDPEIAFANGAVTKASDGTTLLGGGRWMALQTTAVRTAGTTAIQLSEFEFYNGTTKVPMTGVLVTNPGFNGIASETPEKAADGNLTTKWLDNSFVSGERLIFEFPAGCSFDSYRFATGGDAQLRDPLSWNLQTSEDGIQWNTIDSRTNANVPTARREWTENFKASSTNAAGRAFLLARMGLREATAAEILRAKEAGTPGVINQWTPTLQVGPGERPVKVNAYGFETGDTGTWVVPIAP